MKVVGKKDLAHGKNITTMFMIYILILLVVVAFMLSYKQHILFWSTILALSVLSLERLVAIVRFKMLPNDLIVMHRECIEIKQHKSSTKIKYVDIKDIEVSSKSNKCYIVTTFTDKIFVKYLDNPLAVKKEILDYRDKYYNK